MPTQTKIVSYKNNDNNNGIIAMDDIPQQPHNASLVVNNTNNDDKGSNGKPADKPNDDNDRDNDNSKESIDNSSEGGDEDAPANEHELDEDGDQVVWRSHHKGRGIIKKYADYDLLMAVRKNTRGGPSRTLICDRCVLFSTDELSNVKPIPEVDREEYALGVMLVHYSMNPTSKSSKTRAKQE
jgi:hypothetical protein